eukprot:scaffold345264_cov45-Prasinocladus_malaysianus.AAC.1
MASTPSGPIYSDGPAGVRKSNKAEVRLPSDGSTAAMGRKSNSMLPDMYGIVPASPDHSGLS